MGLDSFSHVSVTDAETAKADIEEAPNLRYLSVEVQSLDMIANGGMGDVMNLGKVEVQSFDMVANGGTGDVMNLGNNNQCDRSRQAEPKQQERENRAKLSMTWDTESYVSVVPK